MPSQVRVTHRVHPQVIAQLRAGNGLRSDTLRRCIRVQTAARDRLGSNPRRIDTGRLRASIAIAVILESGTWVGHIGTNVDYAIFVHEGTRYMEANPFLRDALQAAAG